MEKKAVNTMVEISGMRSSFVLHEDEGAAGQFIDLGQVDLQLSSAIAPRRSCWCLQYP